MSSIVKEHQANGVSLYKAACEKEMITSCFHYLNEKLKIYLSLPASMNAAASKRHFLRFSTTPGFTIKEDPYHRTGFMLPIDPPVKNVLKSFLSGTPGEVIFNLIGNAELREITAITSEPGVTSQTFHSDGNWSEYEPRIITVFLAMHDILDEAMGPTRFCPKTHMPNCFPNNKWIPPIENLAENRNPIWFKMVAGSAVLMDSTTWHCGSSNTSNQNRTLLSFSFVAFNENGMSSDNKLRLSNFREV